MSNESLSPEQLKELQQAEARIQRVFDVVYGKDPDRQQLAAALLKLTDNTDTRQPQVVSFTTLECIALLQFCRKSRREARANMSRVQVRLQSLLADVDRILNPVPSDEEVPEDLEGAVDARVSALTDAADLLATLGQAAHARALRALIPELRDDEISADAPDDGEPCDKNELCIEPKGHDGECDTHPF